MKEVLFNLEVTLVIAVPQEHASNGDRADAYLADAANEILRGQQRSFAPDSCLLDYGFRCWTKADCPVEGYTEGDAFT